MGEARRKKEKLVADTLAWLDRWDFAPTDDEARLAASISELELLHVRRYPAEVLAKMRMPPNQCHANARFMVENDPEGRCEQVTGWCPQMGNYVLHSVVRRDGEMFCVTPYPVYTSDTFEFIPDPDIEWVEEDGVREAYRNGYRIEYGIRPDPSETMRINEVVRRRIKAGVHPMKAGEPPFDD